jgi:hypothetical protein
MTHRTINTLLLFAVALLAVAVFLPLTLWVSSRIGLAPGAWLAPCLMLASLVIVFFAGRSVVLPKRLATPRAKALAVLTLWMGITMSVAALVIWLTRPLMAKVGAEHGTLAVTFVCLVASIGLLDRLAANRERGR